MRVFFPVALIFLLYFPCFSLSGQTISAQTTSGQEAATVRVGVAVLRSAEDVVSATEARDQLVTALNQHKADGKAHLALQAIALDALPGAQAIAEGKGRRCQFALYIRVEALEKSRRLQRDAAGSSQNVDVATALLEYELRHIPGGSLYAIGTARGGEADSGWAAILDAITWIPNKVAADLRNSGNTRLGSPAPLGNDEESELHVDEDTDLDAGSCEWLPKNIPHSDALRSVCEYAVTQPEKMPNFICQQETSRYVGRNRMPTDLVTATIRYVDGKETYLDLKRNGKPVPGAMWNTVGLWSSGQFGSSLRDIFNASNRAGFAFSGEKKIGVHAAWVFTYRIARQYEPLWLLRAEDQLAAPPYEGELWVDEKTGEVLRFRSTARDISANFPTRSADIVTDYDHVTFPDGTSILLPVKSTVATRHRQDEPTRNVVEFHGCRRFRATSRMLLEMPSGTPEAGLSVAETSAELALELEENEKIYGILREEGIAEDAPQFIAEQQQELKIATGEAFWKIAQLQKQREKMLASEENTKPDSSYELVSNSNGTTTFKVNVRLVPVSIVVRDRKGHALGNFKKEDFQLLDNRKPQEIINFSVEKGGGTESKERSTGAAEPKPSAVRNNVAYVFDDLHTAPADLAQAKSAAERHLAKMHPEDRGAIFTTSGEIALDFTADQEKLHAALQKLKSHTNASLLDCPALSYYIADAIVNQGDANALQLAMEDALECTFPDARVASNQRSGPGASLSSSSMQEQSAMEKARRMVLAEAAEVAALGRAQSDQTIGMLHTVLARTAAMTGRRSMVVLSPGFLALTREQQKGAMYLIERGLQTDVVVNIVDVRGIPSMNLASNRNHINEPTETQVLSSQESTSTGGVIADLAYGTGGTYFHNNNDLDEGFRRAANAPEYVYVVGFAPQKLDGKFHKLKVKLNGSEKLIVQARQGYYALKPNSGH